MPWLLYGRAFVQFLLMSHHKLAITISRTDKLINKCIDKSMNDLNHVTTGFTNLAKIIFWEP
jgi:hypothetical protein